MAITDEYKEIVQNICMFLQEEIQNQDKSLDHFWMQGLYTDFEWKSFVVNRLPSHISTNILSDAVKAKKTSWNALYSTFLQHTLANEALYPDLFDLIRSIQNRKDHFRFIRSITSERGINIKIYLASVDSSQNEALKGKWCRLVSQKNGILEEPEDKTLYEDKLAVLDMDTMTVITDSSKRHSDTTLPILMHLVVNEETFPTQLKRQIRADGTIQIQQLVDYNKLWMEKDWHLVSIVYGAFAGLDYDLNALAKDTLFQVDHRRPCKRSTLRAAKKPSANISQVRPDFQGNVGPVSNIKKGKKHESVSRTLVDGRNYMFDFFVNVLSTFYEGQVKRWRDLAYGASISLEGVSRTAICGMCQDGYSAMLHLDEDDPTHTYGLRFKRPIELKVSEYQFVLPGICIKGSNKVGLIMGQDTGSITVWSGTKLLHTNSVGSSVHLGTGWAPGMVIVQKPRTFLGTHNLHPDSFNNIVSAKEKVELAGHYKGAGYFP
ncbi:hypothetical protein BJ508DRAFT_333738 [Ascobolus immersus RN42]|uniref:Uncharacterized protein n=1 Tax=Ascobolus immersus RN42 TaxID=1160509 RepID=A0A3N4HIL2_ASCIM|nr:hypothetical protein BJ508DRAFT_333738 [Ascobolus immersus RN42]